MEQDIQKACRLGDIQLVKKALGRDPKALNRPDSKLGWAPLYRAVVCQHPAIVSYLLKQGADPNITNRLGETALYQAIENGLAETAQYLIDSQADPNLANAEGDTPLHAAVRREDVEMVRRLLTAGAKPNVQNRTLAQTPLHFATAKDSSDIIKILLQFKASAQIKDRNGKTAIDLADNSLVESTCQAQTLPAEQVVSEAPDVNPSLVSFLEAVKLEHLTRLFVEAGFNDIDALAAQMRGDCPITRKDLLAAGISKPGHIARILAKLEDASIGKTTRRAYIRLSTIGVPADANPLQCCVQPTRQADNGSTQTPSLAEWLAKINLPDLHAKFVQAGYDDLELIYYLMSTNYALHDKQLEDEVGILRPGHRNRILSQLSHDLDSAQVTSQRRFKIDKEKTASVCGAASCNLM